MSVTRAARVFEMWAPDDCVWSPWVKPALFAQDDGVAELVLAEPAVRRVPWLETKREQTALILDLPGDQSVELGLELSQLGYRPVPLFNTTRGDDATLDVRRLQGLLFAGAPLVAQRELPKLAPPAFLLDSDRRKGHVPPNPGKFDNRWVVFPQDFPSANRLREHGISRVVVWQRKGNEPADDLAHVLLRFQEQGIAILLLTADGSTEPLPMQVRRPPWYRSLLERLYVGAGFRANSAGGFGGQIPMPSSSSG